MRAHKLAMALAGVAALAAGAFFCVTPGSSAQAQAPAKTETSDSVNAPAVKNPDPQGTPSVLATPADTAKSAQIARGLYLTRLGDCIACHTAAGGKPFAGGYALQTPFGKLVASNITPDRDTGIGGWTQQEFNRAVRKGVGKHGEYLYSAMPYPAYSKITDQDMVDMKAYLDTVAPVNNHVVSNQLPFPFNIRFMMFGWNLLFFHDAPFKNDDRQSVEWNRGAYLVDGLGHCAACHSAKNFLGGDKAALQGGELQGWWAPEITSNADTGLGAWSVADVTEYLKTGGNVHSVASGPMAEAVTNSTQHFSDADLHAVATYLKSFPGSDSKAGAPLAAGDAAMLHGQALFLANCAACHSSAGTGVPGMVSSLANSAGIRAPEPANLLQAVLIGSRGAVTVSNPTGAAMPNFSWKLSDGEIADIATYVRNSWGNAASAVSAGDVAKVRKSLDAQAALQMAASK